MVRRRLAPALAAIAVAVTLTPAVPGHALVTGALDPAFGTGGVTQFDLSTPSIDVANAGVNDAVNGGPVLAGSANDRFALAGAGCCFGNNRHQVLVDFDRPSEAYGIMFWGDLVAVGRTGDDLAVARLNSSGIPVKWFGDRGRVVTSLGRPAVGRGVTHYGDDAILAGTVGVGTDADVVLARYDSHGRLVPAYGNGGVVVDDVSGTADAANAIVADPTEHTTGRNMVAGRAGGAVLVARYLRDGTPDVSFGTGGRTLLDLTPGDDVAYGLAVRSDGGVAVAGMAGTSGFVARLTPAGQPDPAFGSGGVVTVDVGPGGVLRSLRLTGTDKVVAGGTVGGTDGMVLRLNVDGSVDTGFGTSGRTVLDLGGPSDRGNAVLGGFGPGEGGILVGGDGADMRAVQVDGDGRPVPLGNGRDERIDFSVSSEGAEEMVVQPDGAVVVVGTGDPGLVLTRFRPDGRLDAGFGRGGVVVQAGARGSAVALQVDGKIVVAGNTGVYRFLPDGRIDPSFGNYGSAELPNYGTGPVGAVAVRPDGHIVVGSSEVTLLSPSGTVERFDYVGERRAVTGLAVQPDNEVVAVLHDFLDHTATTGSAQRYNADGTRDPEGWAWLDVRPGGIARLSDGRFAVAGTVAETAPNGTLARSDVGLVTLSPDLRVDTASAGRGGVARVDVGPFDSVSDLAAGVDGKILVPFAYSGSEDESPARMGVARYLADGRLDRSFAGTGTWVSTVRSGGTPSAAVAPSGRVLVSGVTVRERNNADFLLAAIGPSLVASGTPRAWGFGGLGQLGVGSAPVIALAGGTLHTLAVAADGTVRASGWNATGQLGNGTTVDSSVPVKVTGLTGVVAVAAGAYHSVALRSDGTVWAWGWNHFGQLGNATTVDSRTAVRVAGLTQVKAIAAGAHHTLAVRADGTAWAWGWNGVGQLGTGTTVDSAVPVRVPIPAGVTAVAAGSYHSLFLYINGIIASAGWNAFGQLGRNSEGAGLATAAVEGSGPFPTQSVFVAVAGGGLHSLAVRADGTVWSWGFNALGELGDGTATDRPRPVLVKGVTNAADVAAGAYHSMVLGRDGTVRAWGWNGYGQLGTGTGAVSAVPLRVTAVPAGPPVTGIAGGALHSLAY